MLARLARKKSRHRNAHSLFFFGYRVSRDVTIPNRNTHNVRRASSDIYRNRVRSCDKDQIHRATHMNPRPVRASEQPPRKTPFNIFMREKHAMVMALNGKVTVADIKDINRQWTGLTDAEREPYEAQATNETQQLLEGWESSHPVK